MSDGDDNEPLLLDKYSVYSFDKALRRTISNGTRETDNFFRRFINWVNMGAPFQNIYIFLTILQTLMMVISQYMQQILEKEPAALACKFNGDWVSCSKEYICENELILDVTYRVVEDEEYIDNWV